MEARLNRIEEEVKRISTIEASILELRYEVKNVFKGLAQRFNEPFLQHRRIASTIMVELQIGAIGITKASDPPDIVASKVIQFVVDSYLVNNPSFDLKSEVKSKIRGMAVKIEEPLVPSHAHSSKLLSVQHIKEPNEVKLSRSTRSDVVG
ncbi:hypothetical protein Sjap_020138 [Stephania japonica]|uniref:Uncharacterized protein n=1 Tax=Stephania japonica TaxID=461633 RepID=A0AAP0I0F8_9MAGN